MTGLSHIDERGCARMVDVGGKAETERVARAEAVVRMADETLAVIEDEAVPKGDVVATARLAGIMAAKRTHELIPLCHQLNLSAVSVEIEADRELPGLRVTTEARLHGRTGVEMEALVAASVAALTIYDMCKAMDRGMEVTGVRLLEKSGGRSGTWRREEQGGGDAGAAGDAAGGDGAAADAAKGGA
jgi:cyclic pyranopterin phosphate synthase